MGLIILDRDNEGNSMQLRSHMRSHMRGSYRGNVSMKDEHEEAYKKGYEEGWRDCEQEMQGGESFRRSRDSQGRYM